ncbi:putative tetratricopeptide-like helical domain superfamily [Helianthus annuus]|nr:putative tetratricopeptide-like helical domain superfamily [Helianthus annuus]
MRKKNCMPNLLTYSSLIYGLCLDGNVARAEILLEEMENKGIIPDHVTYTSLIDGYVSLNQVDRAFSLLQKMVSSGCKPNYRTFCVLMKGLEKESWVLFEKAVGQHEAMVDFCSSGGKGLTFANLLDRMLCEPTVDTYSNIISGLCKEGKSTEGVELFHNMEEKSITPDLNRYASLIAVHCKNLKMEATLEFFNLMLVGGFEPHIKSYKALICGLCKIGQMSKARELFENMLDQQWDADEVVWTILIDGVLREADVDTCVRCIHIMESKNRIPNFETYVMLAKQVSATDDVNAVFDKLKPYRRKTPG